jgi:hypothetical protein
MDKFIPGEHIVFLFEEELIDGYLMKRDILSSDQIFWLITTDKDISNKYLDQDTNCDYRLSEKIKYIKELYILKCNDKRIKKYKLFNKFLGMAYIRRNTQYNYEIYKYFLKGNNKAFVFLKATMGFSLYLFKFIFNVIVVGIIDLIFGQIVDYFKNRQAILKIKYKLNNLKGLYYLSGIMGDNSNNKKEFEEQYKELKEQKNKLQEKRLTLNSSLVALILAIISIIISLTKK